MVKQNTIPSLSVFYFYNESNMQYIFDIGVHLLKDTMSAFREHCELYNTVPLCASNVVLKFFKDLFTTHIFLTYLKFKFLNN